MGRWQQVALVPEYRLRLPYVPRAIFKPYHARPQRWVGKTVATINDLVRATLCRKLPHPRGWYISPTYARQPPSGYAGARQRRLQPPVGIGVANRHVWPVRPPRPGDMFIYHRGELARDKMKDPERWRGWPTG